MAFSLRLLPYGFAFGPPLPAAPAPPPAPPLHSALHPYDRSTRAFLEDVESGFLPADCVLLSLMKAPYVREGCLVCELADYRAAAPLGGSLPAVTRVLLRPTTGALRSDIQRTLCIVVNKMRERATRGDPPAAASNFNAAAVSASLAVTLESAVLLRTYPLLALGPVPPQCAAALDPALAAAPVLRPAPQLLTPWPTPQLRARCRASTVQHVVRPPPPPPMACAKMRDAAACSRGNMASAEAAGQSRAAPETSTSRESVRSPRKERDDAVAAAQGATCRFHTNYSA